jgi:hypothetical protein
MTENETRSPDGRDEASTVNVGDPARISEQHTPPAEEQHRDLDARQDRISTTRKPMGPQSAGDRGGPADEPDADVPAENPQEPTDPTEEARP